MNFDTGAVIGKHDGIHYWTVGQRSRLSGNEKQLFILHKDLRTNRIYVAAGTDHPALYTRFMYTEPAYWIDQSPMRRSSTGIFRCWFRFQHTKPLVRCTLVPTNDNGGLMVCLDEPLRAITAGQYAVFYDGDECLGSARIQAPGPSELY